MNKEHELEAQILQDFQDLEHRISLCPQDTKTKIAQTIISKLKRATDTSSVKLRREDPYVCSNCDHFKCYSKASLLKHQASYCSTTNFTCPTCSKVFRSQISFHVHVRAHSNPSALLSCELCEDFKSTEPESLRRHLQQSHVENGPYFCEICDREFFGGRAVFRNHLKLHTEDKDFSCSHCEKTFINRGRLNSHMAAVHKQKSFQCELCPSVFGTKFSLQRHALKHNKDSAKIFQCSSCTYKTPILSNLTKHVQEVHKEFSFQGGKVFRPSHRKILTLSSEEHYKELMEKKSREITRSYLKEFSQRIGKETDAQELRMKGEELVKVVDALLESTTTTPTE